MRSRRLPALLLSALLLIAACAPLQAEELQTETAAFGEIHISTCEELEELALNGTGEEYTIGKSFVLDADLDFTGREFSPIPVFSGSFNGQKHTISGLSYAAEGSDLGLFRFIGETGVIRDLNVKGEFTPEGEMLTVGGIAGTNKGWIDNCSFSGRIRGRNTLGGICGVNEEAGQVTRSISYAMITGTKNLGGICGINKGLLQDSSNRGRINATSETIPTEEMNAERAIDFSKYLQDMARIENVGGIAGLNDEAGRIENCANAEPVGYPHMGYGVGGICGMQKGFLSGCANGATIYGRKDVGGIAGIFSPYTFINYEDDAVILLEKQLDTLSGAVDTLQAYADLLDDELTAGSHDVRSDIEELRTQLREYKDYYREKGRLIDLETDYQLDEIQKKIDKIDTDLRLDEIVGEGRRLKGALTSLTALEMALDDQLDPAHLTEALHDQIEGVRSGIIAAMDAMGMSPSKEELEQAVAEELKKHGITYDPETGRVTGVEGEVREKLKDELGGVLNTMDGSLDEMLNIMEGSSSEVTKLKSRLEDLRKRGKKLREFLNTQKESLREDVDETDETLTAMNDDLHDSISGTLDELDENKAQVRDSLHRVREDVRNARQVVQDGTDRLREKLRDDEIYYDISDDDSAEALPGRVLECTNQGEIEGDINSGGVIGRIAIDLSNDAGFTINEVGEKTLNFEQDVRASLIGNRNYADISAKNDYAGGIVGRADFGAMIRCENYGNITAVEGNYAGGIAGFAKYRVRGCYSLCNVAAADYAGGITGFGKDVFSNVAMASAGTTKGARAGTIAGEVDPDGQVYGNTYVAESQGAVNNVTYIDQADAIDYYSLIADQKTPGSFYRFLVRFVSGGTVLKTLICDYGTSVSDADIPEIPPREGYYADWEDVDLTNVHRNLTVHAVYSAWNTTLASDLVEEGMHAAFLGADFYPDSALTAQRLEAPAEKKGGYETISGLRYRLDYEKENRWDRLELRVLAPDMRADTLGLLQDNGEITILDTERVQSYLKTEVSDTEGVILVLSGGKAPVYLYVIAGIAGLCILALILRFMMRKGKGRG